MHSWSTLRSYARDGSVAEQKLAPGTVRRVATYAGPYRRTIAFFLGLTVVDALLVVASPLLLLRLIDDGVTPGDKQVVVTLALIVAGLAVVRLRCCRWFCAGTRRGSVRASSTTCAARCSTTSSGCRSPSSSAPRPGR